MFYQFRSQEERRASGSGQLLEFQYGVPGADVLSLDAISFWKDDSLYLHHDDFAAFDVQYGKIIRLSGTAPTTTKKPDPLIPAASIGFPPV